MRNLSAYPYREYLLVLLVLLALIFDFTGIYTGPFLLIVVSIGALPTFWRALKDIVQRDVTIDVFNTIALGIALALHELRSGAFIVLMLAFARLLDWYTETKSHNAVAELLKLKPVTAFLEKNGALREVNTESVKAGDILVVRNGARVPVDGVVVSGSASINESSVTGESALVEKRPGNVVLGLTFNESGTIKVRATRVGKDSTTERMAELIREASKRKSNPEKIANKFTKIFLPIVGALGALTYLITRDPQMTSAVFLVACADDMAVAIPLAMTAAFGRAAKRGIVVKGGTALETLGKVRTLVFDKTGTLTYGKLHVLTTALAPGIDPAFFWNMVGTAEKFSEHPLGKAIFRESVKTAQNAPDPDDFKSHKGSGVWAKSRGNEAALGDESLFEDIGIILPTEIRREVAAKRIEARATVVIVYLNRTYAGLISVADIPRSEAKESIERLQQLGVQKILMFTGDNREVAEHVATGLGIHEVRAGMLPDHKFSELEKLEREGVVGMVGDGVNDAPALSRVDLAIAMGSEGAAITVEAADIVILTDNLARLPEAVVLARRTMSVIRIDMAIWLASNLIGFALVFTGVAGPAIAAFYNFITDFFPLINSARLFGKK